MKSKWFSHERVSENSEANLLLFTYAGGNASSFAPWKRKISERVSFYPVLYPARATRISEDMPESVTALAENFVNENEEIFQKDVIMFSHCTGALVAYEVFKYASRKFGFSPKGFIASCSASPNFRLLEEDVTKMSDADFLGLLVETGRIDEKTAGMPNFCEYYLPILKKDFIMIQNYHSDEPVKLSCPFDTVTADNDNLVKPHQVADWQNFSEKTIRNKNISGEHFYIEKNVKWICEYVNSLTDEYLND